MAGPLRLAHRGDWRHGLENSVAAFRAALAVPGCDGVEFDVRVTADGVPVIYHDETLARLHGRPERIDDLRSDVLVDLGIPTLEEAFAAIGRRAFVDVELKVDTGLTGVEILAAARGAELRNAVVSSFDRHALESVRRRAPAWKCWLNTHDLEDSTIADAVAIGCAGVSVEWHAIDAEAIARARAAGLSVAAWTIRRRATAERLAAIGVIAVCVEGAALDG